MNSKTSPDHDHNCDQDGSYVVQHGDCYLKGYEVVVVVVVVVAVVVVFIVVVVVVVVVAAVVVVVVLVVVVLIAFASVAEDFLFLWFVKIVSFESSV